MLKKLPAFAIALLLVASMPAFSQLTIQSGATFFIQSGGVVTVQGDLTSNTDIQGTGKILLQGSSNQNVNMNGFTIPNLEINNTSNATLTGNTRIGTSLLFTNGKIFASSFNLNLADFATVSGMGTSKFVETNGTGQVLKELTVNVTSNEIPVGAGTVYRPAFITTSGSYSSASVGVKVLAVADPNKPPKISDYISAYWPITRTGVTGTVTVAGQYADADISGTESNLRGYYFNGTDWSSATGGNIPASNQISSQITASGDLSGLDKFDLLKARAFLRGAFNTSTGVMDDNLRTSPNLIPSSDPYRTSPYTGSFTHVANTGAETTMGTPFADQASTNDNIVDWVFLELRDNATAPNNVLQTRSALIQRDGDIVDVDGVSPVTFNNVANGNYTIAVRHRNHLGLGTNQSTYTPALSETKSTATLVDFTTATASQLSGTAGASYLNVNSKNMLMGGNANFNTTVRFNGLNNDKDYLLITTLGNDPAAVQSNVYSPADVNMNRIVRFNGLNNDKDFILITILGSDPAGVKTQVLPN